MNNGTHQHSRTLLFSKHGLCSCSTTFSGRKPAWRWPSTFTTGATYTKGPLSLPPEWTWKSILATSRTQSWRSLASPTHHRIESFRGPVNEVDLGVAVFQVGPIRRLEKRPLEVERWAVSSQGLHDFHAMAEPTAGVLFAECYNETSSCR